MKLIELKLQELKGYKTDPSYQELVKNRDLTSFIKNAKEKGWKFYGAGMNGSVLGKPGANYVYKIYNDSPYYGGYLEFVKWARQHQDNPFVPKVGAPFKIPKTFYSGDGGIAHGIKPHGPTRKKHVAYFYVNKIEKLEPATGYNDPRFEKYIHKDHVKIDYSDQEDNPYYSGGSSLYRHAMDSLYQFDSHWKEIIKFAEATLDLGINNVMFRKNGQLVFADPMT